MDRSIGFWCGAAIIVSCGFIMVYMVRAAPLDMYHWRYSPVLVFSPSIKDIRFDVQMRNLRDQEIAFKERSVIVVTVAGNEPLLADETLPPPVSPTALRQEFGVDERAFTVIMIDKSGKEIFRKEGVVDGEALVKRIDELTTRRNRKKWGEAPGEAPRSEVPPPSERPRPALVARGLAQSGPLVGRPAEGGG